MYRCDRWWAISALLILSSTLGLMGQIKTPSVQEIRPPQATIAEIIPLQNADLIRIDGNYEHGLTAGVVCTVSTGSTSKGEIIIIHARLKTAYALITDFSGSGDFLPGDRVTPKRSITF